MNRIGCFAGALAAVLVFGGSALNPALAQTTETSDYQQSLQAQMQKAQAIAAIENGRAAFVDSLLGRWAADAAARGYDAYLEKGTRKLMPRSAQDLFELSTKAKDFDTFYKLVFEGYRVNAFGDLTQDLVYIPINACRLYDSRFATGGLAGPMAPGTERSISVNDSTATQGGASPDCRTTYPDLDDDPPALAVTLSAVSPTGPGNLRTFAAGASVPLAAMLTFTSGTTISTGVITSSCTSCGLELTVRNQGAGSTDVVVDLVGYFHAPAATALDCTTVTGTAVDLAVGAFGSASVTACPTGYAQVSLDCNTSNYYMTVAGWNFSARLCYFRNEHATISVSGTASVECCRVPGR